MYIEKEKKKRVFPVSCSTRPKDHHRLCIYARGEIYINRLRRFLARAEQSPRWSFFFILNWLHTGVGNPIGTEFI